MNNDLLFKEKYLKYKNKYLQLKNSQKGGDLDITKFKMNLFTDDNQVGMYTGEIVDEKRNGFGIMIYKSDTNNTCTKDVKEIYIGKWINDKRDDAGIMRYVTKDGFCVYSGFWRDGVMDSVMDDTKKGIFITSKGVVYFGFFGKNTGGGSIYKDDKVFTGQWEIIQTNGTVEIKEGTITEDNNSKNTKLSYIMEGIYIGQFSLSINLGIRKRHGYGVMKYNNGDVYVGGWEDDKRKGYGIMKYKNGKVYVGMWHFNMQSTGETVGIKLRADNSVCHGKWINGDQVSGFKIMCDGKVEKVFS
jgi:hypothetical protein